MEALENLAVADQDNQAPEANTAFLALLKQELKPEEALAFSEKEEEKLNLKPLSNEEEGLLETELGIYHLDLDRAKPLSEEEEYALAGLIEKLVRQHKENHLKIVKLSNRQSSYLLEGEKEELSSVLESAFEVRKAEKLNGHFDAISKKITVAKQRQLTEEIKQGRKLTKKQRARQLEAVSDELNTAWLLFKKKKNQLYAEQCLLLGANLRMVIKTARFYSRFGMSINDLIQEGNVGLWRAIDTYNRNYIGYDGKRARFYTYAQWWVRQKIYRALQCQSRDIRLPIHINEDLKKLFNSFRKLWQENKGQVPSLQEVADDMAIPLPKAQKLILSSLTGSTISLSLPTGRDDESSLEDCLPDNIIPTPDTESENQERKRVIDQALASLTPREAGFIKRRFGLNGYPAHTLEEIGQLEKVSLSRERVRQIIEKALWKLRSYKNAEKLFQVF